MKPGLQTYSDTVHILCFDIFQFKSSLYKTNNIIQHTKGTESAKNSVPFTLSNDRFFQLNPPFRVGWRVDGQYFISEPDNIRGRNL